MNQSVYFRLLLIALCSCFECAERRYHYVDTEKTWTEAKSYCRETYTDLATVNSKEDMEQLMISVKTQNVEVWIGLKKSGDYKWKWVNSSLGDPVKYLNWENAESNDQNDCAVMSISNRKWHYHKCDMNQNFICYNETKGFFFETSQKSWRDAQQFCRQYHVDLASVTNQSYSLIKEAYTRQATTNEGPASVTSDFWIGLFRDPWEWSDNSSSTYRNWKTGEPNGGQSGTPVEECTVAKVNMYNQYEDRRWNDESCSKTHTFVCHENRLILIKENLSWPEALKYCREKHVDLVSVDSEKIQPWLTEVVKEASTTEVWLGLRHSCTVGIWFWVNGEIMCYENWAPENGGAVEDCEREVRSGAVQSVDQRWISLPQTKKLNFICIRYD